MPTDERMSFGTRVLLVDDDSDCRIIYASALEAAGFLVTTAEDGITGVELAQVQLPHVIVLDVAMPGMDGRDAVRKLKADPSTRRIPTVAVTAVASAHTRGELEDAGFDAVLLKPVIPSIVVAAVRQAAAGVRT